ncbi:MAG: peptidase S41 [Candidatus Aminicenantes bacterium]|nr:peptidase S41 [Candidatus Aminicenantes bacterium]
MQNRAALWRVLGLAAILSLFVPGCQKNTGEESRVISNLRAFAKLFGYVRYFHPSDESSRIDWDAFAIYGSEKVKDVKNALELKAALEELFSPLAPTAAIYRTGEAAGSSKVPRPEDSSNYKVVAWQHRGLGFGRGNSPYMSVRINTENILWSGMGAGVLAQGIDARNIRGKDFRLKAYVKTNVLGIGNQAQLWLRVDRENNKRGFFDNMDDRPIQSSDWREYEISGKVDSDALTVFFGGILSGNGQSWWDGFRLWAKGEGGDWEPLDIRNSGFEEDTAGQKPSYWGAQSPGYKYHIQEQDSPEGPNCLLLESGSVKFSGKLFEEYPKIGECILKELDGGLSCTIPLALPGDGTRTLGSEERAALDALVSELKSYETSRLTANREDVRLGDVIIAWNVFQHFYPYFDVIGGDWDAELTRALDAALSDMDEEAFFETLSRLVAGLKDGHGNVMHKSRMDLAGLPIRVEWIEKRLVVTVSQDPRHFRRGDIIKAIDGTDAEQVLINAETLFSGSPQWKRYKSCLQFGYGKEGSLAGLVVKRGQENLEFEVERRFKGTVVEQKHAPIRELHKGIYYIDLDRAPWVDINAYIDTLARAKGIICDMRGYPKGNHEIICHLLKENDTSNAWMQIPQIFYPDGERVAGYQKMGWNLMAKEPHIEGKVVFITDGRAISYAESFLSFIEYYKLGEIVGQPTAGANGNVNPFSLPGGYTIAWTGMKVLKHDGSQHHLIGIQPTVPCERTVGGVLEGRDELLERALELID